MYRLVLAVAILLPASFAHAGELLDEITGEKACEPPGLCLDAAEQACDNIPQCDPPSFWDRGTLFRWCGSCVEGGPDLDAPLVTDRPDFTEASSTVGKNVVQLEMGYTFTYEDRATNTRSQTYPELLARIGLLADWLEFRVAWNYTTMDATGVSVRGSDDLYLGVKIGLMPQDGWLPEMAIMPQMTVPSGDPALTSGDVLPGINWLYSWEINDRFSLGANTQVNRAIDEVTGVSYTEFAQSVALGIAIEDNFGAYIEYFGFYPHEADSAMVEHYVDGGFTLLMGNDVQWDIRAGVGLNDAADDYFIGMGVSIRFK